MGADSLNSFDQWRDWETIFQTVPIAVFNRPGFEASADTAIAARQFCDDRLAVGEAMTLAGTTPPAWVFFSDTDNPMSSTAIRAGQVKPNSNSQSTGELPMDDETIDIPAGLTHFVDTHPAVADFRADVIAGLSSSPKSLSPKYFYDQTGSGAVSENYPDRRLLSDAYRVFHHGGQYVGHCRGDWQSRRHF